MSHLTPDKIPLTLYIHMPWCEHKCPYCDFNSYKTNGPVPESDYVEHLLADLQRQLPSLGERNICAIYIGGGTPSLFSPASYEKLFDRINQQLNIDRKAEITMEANPGSSERDKFAGFRKAGINRLSIGVQSFNDDKLRRLGRVHSAKEATGAVNMARQAGFDDLNIDIMFGLPQQTVEEGLSDVQSAIDLEPDHLSWYQLTLEPNTLFYQKPPDLPDDEVIEAIHDQGKNRIAKSGFQQYEVSAFSKSGYECRHNLNYWLFGDYVGIGAGAHSKITMDGAITRVEKLRSPSHYLSAANSYHYRTKLLTTEESIFEFMLNALRLHRPIGFDLFTERTGLLPENIQGKLQMARDEGLLDYDSNTFATTEMGKRYLNELLQYFL